MAIRINASTEGLVRTTNLNALSFTISCWFKKTGVGGNQYRQILGFNQGVAGWLILNLNNTTDGLYISETESYSDLNLVINNNTWYYLALTRNNTSNAVYGYAIDLNNTVYQNDFISSDMTAPTELTFGNNIEYGEWTDCVFDNIIVWDTPLTQEELLIQMYSRLPIIKTSNIFLWAPCLSYLDLNDHYNNYNLSSMGGTLSTEDGAPISWNTNVGFHIKPILSGGTQYNQSISGLIIPSGIQNKSISKFPNGLITPSGTQNRKSSKSFGGLITPSGTQNRKSSKSFGGLITPSGLLSQIKTFGKLLSGFLIPSGFQNRKTNKQTIGNFTPTGNVIRRIYKSLFSGSININGTLLSFKLYLKTMFGSINPAGSLIKTSKKFFFGTNSPSGSVASRKILSKIVSGTIILSGNIYRKTIKTIFVGNLSSVGNILKLRSKLFIGNLTITGSTIRTSRIRLSGNLSEQGSLIKKTFKSFFGFIIPSAAVQRTLVKLKFISGQLTISGSFIKRPQKLMTSNFIPSGNISKKISKLFSGILTINGLLNKAKTKLLSISGSINPTGILNKRPNKFIESYLTLSGLVVREIKKIIKGDLTPTNQLFKKTQKIIFGFIEPTGNAIAYRVAGIIQVTLNGALNLTGNLSRVTSKRFSGTLQPLGSIFKRVEKFLSGLLQFTSSLLMQTIIPPTPLIRIYSIPSEHRVLSVDSENRIGKIKQENRIYITGEIK